MSQLIITLIIVIAAAFAAIFLIVKRLRKKPKPGDICNGCSSDCGECSFYKEIHKK